MFLFSACGLVSVNTNIPLFYHTAIHAENISSTEATVWVVGTRASPVRLNGVGSTANISLQPLHSNGAMPMLVKVELIRNGSLEWVTHVRVSVPSTQSSQVALTINDHGVSVTSTGWSSGRASTHFSPGTPASRSIPQFVLSPWPPPPPCPSNPASLGPPVPCTTPPPPPFTRQCPKSPGGFLFLEWS